MKRSLEFNFYLEMWAYIQRSQIKNAKWKKISIKKYVLEWDDGKPIPANHARVQKIKST